MAGQDEVTVAVSLSFLYQDRSFQQSGLLVKGYVLTTGGFPFSLVLSHDVDSIKDFSITVLLERNNKTVCKRGFIMDVFHNKHIADALAQTDFTNAGQCSYFLIIGFIKDKRKKPLEFEVNFKNQRLYKGQDVLTVSTPFGEQIFLNSFHKGIISNVLNEHLFLIDARLSFGSEGGPVYLSNGGNTLIGMILVPLVTDNQYSGFNLCCTLFSIFKDYCKLKKSLIEPSSCSTPVSGLTSLQSAYDAVLLIETPLVKGSCVVINKNGFLITCSHIINFDMNTTVHVKHRGTSYAAKVLCCSSKDDILDVAFLQICPTDPLPACTLDDTLPVKGKTVCVIGFTGINNNYMKLMSKGTVMKHEEHSPVYVSCTTRFGNSGGGIFDDDGRLLAIVCGIVEEPSNMMHYAHGAGIPVKMMSEMFHNFEQTNDIKHLVNFCKTKDLSLSKWVLFTEHSKL